MNRFIQRLQASRIVKVGLHLLGKLRERSQTTIYEEMELGAITGFFASSLIALLITSADISGAVMIFLSSLGLITGAVIGAIIWIGSAELPVEPVRAPGPGQRRKSKDDEHS